MIVEQNKNKFTSHPLFVKYVLTSNFNNVNFKSDKNMTTVILKSN